MFITGLILGAIGGMHCLVMCTPVVLALHPKRAFIDQFLYQSARISVYVVLGILVGLIGNGLAWFGLQRILSIVMGGVILAITLVPSLKKRYYQFAGQGVVIRKVRKWMASGRIIKPISAGVINGMLPCGLVYVALSAALALGDMAESALFMAGFGLGTVPWLMGALFSSVFLSDAFKLRASKAIPVVAVVFGVLFILRGMALDIPYVSPAFQALGLPEAITTCR